MATSNANENLRRTQAMQHIWSRYRVWAVTARDSKKRITRWRGVVLLLSIAGAILATLSEQSKAWSLPTNGKWVTLVVGLLSAAALALAAFFAREALGTESEKKQVRARSAAEGFKSEAYLLAANAPPYDTAGDLLSKSDRLDGAVNDLTPMTLKPEEKSKGVLVGSLTVEDYLAKRVDDQINNYYYPESVKNALKVRRGQQVTFVLGALAVVLGVVGAAFGWAVGWVAVISTIIAAIVANQYAGRYQFLVVSYLATATRLERLKAGWTGDDSDVEARNKFILSCEEAISIENSAWMAEWLKKSSDSAPAPVVSHQNP
jgi:hypothetical protein